ncbi:fimbrial biogenesis chaperone [Bradyrhizobium embrapense]
MGIAMHQNSTLLAAFAASLACMEVAHAAALRVEPVLLELNAPAAAASLTLRNDEDADVEVQTRVLRWSQSDGKESLEPTTDVVASPPAVRMTPHSDYVVRVVRVSKQPVNGEESYRVIVDQLPRAGGSQVAASIYWYDSRSRRFFVVARSAGHKLPGRSVLKPAN